MYRRTAVAIAISLSLNLGAAEPDDARAAADEILNLIHSGRYETVWDSKTSNFFKSRASKDSFLANMTLGRSQLGSPSSRKFISMDFAKKDPASGYEGSIYIFNYETRYSSQSLYERVVVINEGSGFKMSAIWGVPKQ